MGAWRLLHWVVWGGVWLWPAMWAGSEACRTCHREIYDRYAATPMGRSLTVVNQATAIEEWGRGSAFYHAASERWYEMVRKGGGFALRRYQKGEGGEEVHGMELGVTYAIGSGERARSYVHRTAEGRLIQLPVTWYSQERRWGMSPGYDRPNHAEFSRTINHKCMFCHNGYPEVAERRARVGWDADVRFPERIPMGIDCERCHGKGERHVREQTASTIVNPARLSLERQMDVCEQCHLETTSFRLPDSYRRFGRGFYSFRAGEALSEYVVHFDHGAGTGHEEKFEIVSAAYRLRGSECFAKSGGKLVCTTCHNPHDRVKQEDRAEHYRRRCVGCHGLGAAERHRQEVGAYGRSDCVSCHMPLRRTEDVVHVAMTDHRIARRGAADPLRALREKSDAEQRYVGRVTTYLPNPDRDPLAEVYAGIAQVKEKANLTPGLALLEGALGRLKAAFPEPYFELAEAQVAAGKREAARKSYLEAIRRDEEFVQAENNLANLLAGMGRVTEALEHHRKAVKLDPGSAELHRNLGLTLLDAGDTAGAEKAFRSAVQANVLDGPSQREMGALLLSQGKVGPAMGYLREAIRIDPFDALAHQNLGLALAAGGDRGGAVRHMEIAVRRGNGRQAEAARALLAKLRAGR